MQSLNSGEKLTITIDDNIYHLLKERVGPRKISGFLEELVRKSLVKENLDDGYRRMAADEEREEEAAQWAELPFQEEPRKEGHEAW